jgi:hypothetical protein
MEVRIADLPLAVHDRALSRALTATVDAYRRAFASRHRSAWAGSRCSTRRTHRDRERSRPRQQVGAPPRAAARAGRGQAATCAKTRGSGANCGAVFSQVSACSCWSARLPGLPYKQEVGSSSLPAPTTKEHSSAPCGSDCSVWLCPTDSLGAPSHTHIGAPGLSLPLYRYEGNAKTTRVKCVRTSRRLRSPRNPWKPRNPQR